MTKKDLEYYLSLNYKIEIDYEPEDKTWVASHPELGRGTCYAIAETSEEALSLLDEAKKDIIEYALEEGKEIPEPKFQEEILPSGQFLVRLPRTLHQKIKEEADKEGVSLNLYVTTALAEYTREKNVVDLFKYAAKTFISSKPDESNWQFLWANALEEFTFDTSRQRFKDINSNLLNLLIGDPNVKIQERSKKRPAIFISGKLQTTAVED